MTRCTLGVNSKSGGEKRHATPQDIINFLRKNGPSRRVDILTYMTKTIEKENIISISKTTCGNWIKFLKKEKRIIRNNKLYSLPKKSKKTLKQKDKPSAKSENDSLQDIPKEEFSKTTQEQAKLAESMQDTVFLLESTMFLLDTLFVNNLNYIVSDAKYKCRTYKASIKKTIDEFRHLVESHENKYQKSIMDAWKIYCDKHVHVSKMIFMNIRDFREVFSDVILQIRQSCDNNCKRFDKHDTYDKDAVYASCKMISISLNEICRSDYDLVVDSFEYDNNTETYRVDVSDMKMISPYKITKLYCDGKDCIFEVTEEKQESDYSILFYLPEQASDISRHVISIMLQCVEFSFVIDDRKERYFSLLNHIKNDVITQIDSVYPQYINQNIMLTPKMGGEIKNIIESYNGKKFVCPFCWEEHNCKRWIGYPHDGGTPDKDGQKYWMMIRCPISKMDVSLHKII